MKRLVLLAAETTSELPMLQDTLQQVADNPGIIRTYFENMIPDMISFALQVIFAILIYAISAKVIKWVVKLVKKGMEHQDVDTGVIQFLTSIVKYGLYVVVIMTILSLFGIATTSVVAVLGSAGVAVGLALQGSLSNFAGGVLLLLLKPFKVGDYIVQGGVEGTVYEMALFFTKLKTGDNKVVIIPNGTLANSTIINTSHMDKRRVDIEVGISYDADIRTAKEIILNLAQKDPGRLPDQDAIVFVSNLGASSVDIGVRLWVKASDYWAVKWRLTEDIKYAMDANNISIPYTQIDVQIKQ